jgi:ADP-heptose:LPS heptosyltransferase
MFVSVNLPASLRQPRPRREDFRKAANYHLAVWSEYFRVPMRFCCLRLAGGVAPSSPEKWRNGIIIGATHIGDVLYNTASLPALKAALPNCRWSYVAANPSAQVLQNNPLIDEVISLKDDSDGFRPWLKRSQAQLAPYHFDVALACARGSSWQDLSLAASLGIPNRAGYVHKGFSGLVTHPVSIHTPQPFPAYFRDFVCELTGQTAGAVPSLRPLVYTRPEHEEAVERISAEKGIDWRGQPVLACWVTSRQPNGMWPAEQFLQAIQHVRKRTGCTVIYLGAKSDADQLQRLAAETGSGAFVIAGELDLLSVVALLRRCRAALTTDSGSRHLANAAGIPAYFVRNLSSREIETGVYCATEHDFAPPGLEMLNDAEQAAAFKRIDPREVGEEIVRREFSAR